MFFTSKFLLAFTFAFFLSPFLSAFHETLYRHSLITSLDHDFVEHDRFYKSNSYEVLKKLINEYYSSSIEYVNPQERYEELAAFVTSNFYDESQNAPIIQGCLMGGLMGFIAGAYVSNEADKYYDGDYEDAAKKHPKKLKQNFKVYKARTPWVSASGYEKKYLHLFRKLRHLRIK